MTFKTIFFISVVSLAILCTSVAFASSPKINGEDVSTEVILLTAKIENVIADLNVDRTELDIYKSTTLILANAEASDEIKSSAVEAVMQNAIAMGDKKVVDALAAIEFQTKVAFETPVQATSKPVVKASFPPPPATSSTGGSDY